MYVACNRHISLCSGQEINGTHADFQSGKRFKRSSLLWSPQVFPSFASQDALATQQSLPEDGHLPGPELEKPPFVGL